MVWPKRRAKLALVPNEPGSSSMVVACRLFSWRCRISCWSWTHDTTRKEFDCEMMNGNKWGDVGLWESEVSTKMVRIVAVMRVKYKRNSWEEKIEMERKKEKKVKGT